MNECKNNVERMLALLNEHDFVSETSLLTGHPIFYKRIYSNIYVVFCYHNSKHKDYSCHNFDLFLSYSKSIQDLRKEKDYADFWIGSFGINKEDHIRIFNELMAYAERMKPENQFEELDGIFYKTYFGKEKGVAISK